MAIAGLQLTQPVPSPDLQPVRIASLPCFSGGDALAVNVSDVVPGVNIADSYEKTVEPLKYDPDQVYSPDGKLSWSQKFCTYMIKNVYHRMTRYNHAPIVGDVFKGISGSCVFARHDKLSCSEYTLIEIQRRGTLKGILKGAWRILRCNPLTKNFEDS